MSNSTQLIAPFRPIKILNMFGTMNRGGAELRTLEVMRHIDRERFRFEFCCLSGKPGVLDDEIRNLGGEVHLVKFGLSFPSKFRALLRDGNYDIVHSHVHFASGMMLRLAQAANIRATVAHFHNISDGRGNRLPRRLYRRLMMRLIDRYATNILACGERAMIHAHGNDWRTDRRCQMLHYGLEVLPIDSSRERHAIRQELGFGESDYMLVHVARMDPQKNHSRLIEIFSEISKLVSPVALVLVGDLPQQFRSQLMGQASSLNCQGRLIFTGLRSDVPRFLAAADLMLFPSLWEGLPGVVLEAGAAGLPVLASDIAPHAEIARHLSGIHQQSLSSTDTAWAQAAAAILRNDGFDLEQRRQAARKFAESPFNLDAVVKQYESIYEKASGCASHGNALNYRVRSIRTDD